MKWSDKEIDEMFQEIDNKASFEFQESYWVEMEQMLNAKQKKKGFVWWLNGWILIPISVLIFGSGAFAYIAKKNQLKNTVTSQRASLKHNTVENVTSDNLAIVKSEQPDLQTEPLRNNDNIETSTEQTNSLNFAKIPKNNRLNRYFITKNLETSSITPVNTANNLTKSDSPSETNFAAESNVQSSEGKNSNSEESTVNNIEVNQQDLAKINDTSVSDSTTNTRITEQSPDNLIDKANAQKASWRMYIAAGAGLSSNLKTGKNHTGAGVIRLEYGVSKTWGRFTFSPAIAFENSFGTSVSLENNYVSYDFIRSDNKQVYSYNRFTNFMVPIRLGCVLGKKQTSHLQFITSPVVSLYNNLLYKEFSNGKLVKKDEYFNQNLALNRFYMTVGIGYNYQLSNSISIGFEYYNNLGLNRKKQFASNYVGKADHQFIIQLRYFIK